MRLIRIGAPGHLRVLQAQAGQAPAGLQVEQKGGGIGGAQVHRQAQQRCFGRAKPMMRGTPPWVALRRLTRQSCARSRPGSSAAAAQSTATARGCPWARARRTRSTSPSRSCSWRGAVAGPAQPPAVRKSGLVFAAGAHVGPHHRRQRARRHVRHRGRSAAARSRRAATSCAKNARTPCPRGARGLLAPAPCNCRRCRARRRHRRCAGHGERGGEQRFVLGAIDVAVERREAQRVHGGGLSARSWCALATSGPQAAFFTRLQRSRERQWSQRDQVCTGSARPTPCTMEVDLVGFIIRVRVRPHRCRPPRPVAAPCAGPAVARPGSPAAVRRPPSGPPFAGLGHGGPAPGARARTATRCPGCPAPRPAQRALREQLAHVLLQRIADGGHARKPRP